MGNDSRSDSVRDLAHILQALSDLVRLVRECESKELRENVSFVDVNTRLQEIKKQVDTLQENYRTNLARFGLTPEDMEPTKEEIESLSTKEKKMLNQLQELQNTCEKARDSAYKALQQDPETLRRVTDELKSKEGRIARRKSRFKSIGGKKGWMPS
jgi:septation ring formation regulator EzrA